METFTIPRRNKEPLILEGKTIRDALERAVAQGISLAGINLRGIMPRYANLEGANLSGAILRNATFHQANLRGANLRRVVAASLAEVEAEAEVREAIARADDPRIVVLDRVLPWQAAVCAHAPAALLVVYPARGQWNVQCVPVRPGQHGTRIALPAAWAGLTGEALAEATGVEDAVFCHRGRWLVAARSREGALALARLALAAQAEVPHA